MYVAKISGDGLIITASVYQKFWSEELASNQIELIDSKNFFLRRSAKQWINKRICQDLSQHRRMETVYE